MFCWLFAKRNSAMGTVHNSMKSDCIVCRSFVFYWNDKLGQTKDFSLCRFESSTVETIPVPALSNTSSGLSNAVLLMENDNYKPGNILLVTNPNTLVSFNKTFSEVVFTMQRFYLDGFVHLTPDKIVIAGTSREDWSHCLKSIDRVNGAISDFAGGCAQPAAINGIVRDQHNHGQLLMLVPGRGSIMALELTNQEIQPFVESRHLYYALEKRNIRQHTDGNMYIIGGDMVMDSKLQQ